MHITHVSWQRLAALVLAGFSACLALGLAACGLRSAPAAGFSEPLPDPVPLRRMLLPPDRIAAELERARQGVLVKLAREEFEARVQRAALAGAILTNPPRLVEARYSATLVDSSLAGSSQWKVINTAPGATILALDPLNLALQKVRVQKSSASVGAAILGDLDGKSLGLLVEQTGEQAVFIDWTARGDARPGGLHFSLQVPVCAVATLELNLPQDRIVAPRDTYLLSGPFPAEVRERRLWRIDFAGRSQVDVEVRPDPGANRVAPLILASVQTRQDLEPNLVQADFEFSLEIGHDSVRELAFEYDAVLQPYEVVSSYLESWETHPGAAPGAAATLLVRLRQPFQGGVVQVRCLAPLPVDKPWICPSMRLPAAVPRGETLLLRLHPDVSLADWQPGSFHLMRAAAPSGGAAAPDGWLVLPLAAGLPDASGPRRPSARVQALTPGFRARQLSWWQVRPEGSTLTASINYEVAHGRLFRLRLLIPSGWEVSGVDLTPVNLLRTWALMPENDHASLTVDLQRALGPSPSANPAASARLIVRLRQASRPANAGAGLPVTFPDVVPLGAELREGILGISVDPAHRIETIQASSPATIVEEHGPWGNQVLDHAYRYRGAVVEGTLQLRPRRPQVRARCNSEVVLTSGRAAVAMRLWLQPEVGSPDAIDLCVSAPVPGAWNWKTQRGHNQVREAHRLRHAATLPALSGLAVQTPLQALAFLASPLPRGEVWRLVLARPLREPLELEATLNLAASAATVPVHPAARQEVDGQQPTLTSPAQRWEIPVPVILAAEPMDGEITVHLAGTELIEVNTAGLQETVNGPHGDTPSPGRTFRYGGVPVALELQGRATAELFPEEMIDCASLATYVQPEGSLLNHVRFQVRHWRQPALPVRMPGAAQVLAAKVDGRWIARLEPSTLAAGAVELPMPAGQVSHALEIVYTCPAPAWKLWACLEAPAPELPLRPIAFRRTWCLPAGTAPINARRYQRRPDPMPDAGGRASAEDSVFPSLPSPLVLFPRALPGSRNAAEGPDAFSIAALRQGVIGEWVAWEPLAGTEPQQALEVVRQDVMPFLGLIVTAVLCLAAQRARRAPRKVRLGLLLIWLAAGSLALVWLPVPLRSLACWPTLAGAGVALLWYLKAAVWRPTRRTRPEALVGLVLATALGIDLSGQAASPTPFTVFLLSQSAEPAQKQTVLAPADLLDQLQTLAQRGVAGLRNAVLVGAHFDGRVTGAEAEFKTDFQVHCFGDEGLLTLPLGGIQLKEALFDGAPADLQALQLPREGYSFQVKGRGSHMVKLRFAVPIVTMGEDRDLQFMVPELAQSALALDLPAGGQFAYAVAGRGLQRVTATGDPAQPENLRPHRLEVDLGRVGTVHVRWRQEGAGPQQAVVRVREAYLWNIHASASSLFAVLQYRVKQGATDTLAVALPEQTEVRSVEAGRLPDVGPDEPLPRLKEWRLSEGAPLRQVLIVFQRPVSSGVQLTLELVPRQAFGSSVVLALPAPQGALSPEEKDQEPLFAYRLEGLTAQIAENLRIQRIDRDAFTAVWQMAGMGNPGKEIQAFVFQRTAGGAPYLRLNLAPLALATAYTQQVAWQVGQKQADLRVSARLTAPGNDLVVITWQIPEPIIVAGVSGANIRNWSQTGPLLQVWLHHALADTTVQLTGWMPLAPAQGAQPASFHLIPVPVVSAQAHSASIQVTGGTEWALKPERLENLGPLPNAQASERNHAFVTSQAQYGGIFVLQPARESVDARVLTSVEIVDRSVIFTALIDCQVRRGELRTIRVGLRDWKGEDVRFEAPGVIQRSEQPREPDGRIWALTLPAGVTGHYQLRMSGSLPVTGATELLMPKVTVLETARLERWVAVVGHDLQPDDARGLVPLPEETQELQAWPSEADKIEHGGQAWKVGAADWQLRLRPRYLAGGTAPVRIVLSEQSAALLDDRRWVHQATYWLYQDVGTDLSIALPPAAALLAAEIDGADVTPLQPRTQHLWLPLPGPGGKRVVRLRWLFPESEPFAQPNLAQPQLERATEGQVIWVLHIPSGYQVYDRRGHSRPTIEPMGVGEYNLHCAAASLELSAILGERNHAASDPLLTAQLAATQRQFYAFCRRVEQGLTASSPSTAELQQLLERNLHLAESQGFEAVRADAEKQADAAHAGVRDPHQDHDAPVDPLPQRDVPSYWLARSTGISPSTQLVAIQARWLNHATLLSIGLVLLLLAVGILFLIPRWARRFQIFWPEQMLLLGLLGWSLLGPAWVFLLLILLGMAGRVVSLVRQALAWRRSTAAHPQSGGRPTGPAVAS